MVLTLSDNRLVHDSQMLHHTRGVESKERARACRRSYLGLPLTRPLHTSDGEFPQLVARVHGTALALIQQPTNEHKDKCEVGCRTNQGSPQHPRGHQAYMLLTPLRDMCKLTFWKQKKKKKIQQMIVSHRTAKRPSVNRRPRWFYQKRTTTAAAPLHGFKRLKKRCTHVYDKTLRSSELCAP